MESKIFSSSSSSCSLGCLSQSSASHLTFSASSSLASTNFKYVDAEKTKNKPQVEQRASLLTWHRTWWDGKIGEGPFSNMNSMFSFHWRLHAQPLDHGKAINAADHFVTMYKQRKRRGSMSNHAHSLIPSFVLGGCTRAEEWLLLGCSYKQ